MSDEAQVDILEVPEMRAHVPWSECLSPQALPGEEMISLPFTDLDRSRLPAILASAWGDDAAGLAGIARQNHVDPERAKVTVLEAGWLYVYHEQGIPIGELPACERARDALAEHLERLGYAVEWEGGPRVVGWACEVAAFDDNHVAGHDEHGRGLVRICDLDATDWRRIAYDEHNWNAMVARREPAPVDRGREQGIARHAAAYPGGGGRRR